MKVKTKIFLKRLLIFAIVINILYAMAMHFNYLIHCPEDMLVLSMLLWMVSPMAILFLVVFLLLVVLLIAALIESLQHKVLSIKENHRKKYL